MKTKSFSITYSNKIAQHYFEAVEEKKPDDVYTSRVKIRLFILFGRMYVNTWTELETPKDDGSKRFHRELFSLNEKELRQLNSSLTNYLNSLDEVRKQKK